MARGISETDFKGQRVALRAGGFGGPVICEEQSGAPGNPDDVVVIPLEEWRVVPWAGGAQALIGILGAVARAITKPLWHDEAKMVIAG
jgi:hypothetical protein